MSRYTLLAINQSRDHNPTLLNYSWYTNNKNIKNTIKYTCTYVCLTKILNLLVFNPFFIHILKIVAEVGLEPTLLGHEPNVRPITLFSLRSRWIWTINFSLIKRTLYRWVMDPLINIHIYIIYTLFFRIKR